MVILIFEIKINDLFTTLIVAPGQWSCQFFPTNICWLSLLAMDHPVPAPHS